LDGCDRSLDSGRKDSDMQFSARFKYLQNEAFLTHGSLSIGLTAIRNAAHPDKPTFYSGFFNTAVAFERLMKLIVVTDHMIGHSYSVPSRAELKGYGHDLVSLYSSCVAVAARVGVGGMKMPAAASLERELLEFFSDFATHARYYNLDGLSTASPSYEDPLARWDRLLAKVLDSDAPKKKIQELRNRASRISGAIADVTLTVQHGMDGRLLTLEEVLAATQAHALAAEFAMIRIFDLLTPLLELIGKLGDKYNSALLAAGLCLVQIVCSAVRVDLASGQLVVTRHLVAVARPRRTGSHKDTGLRRHRCLAVQRAGRYHHRVALMSRQA
jgi:hypothetical protein